MLRIVINKVKVLKLNQKIPANIAITALTIVSIGPSPASLETCKGFARWVYDLVQHTDGPIMYNGVIIDKSKVKRYEA